MDFIICNTDAQVMEKSPVTVKIQLGVTLTEGRGAGNMPQMGEQAARENYEDLKRALEGTKMLFIAAGMGGGTGTGAAPVIASLARELDILTIAVVTVPSPAEGKKRFGQAMEGIKKLSEYVDSMLVVSNQRLHNIFGDLPARQAFKMADNIVATAVKGVAEIITLHGNVNIDFADVYTVMHNSNVFIMGTGLASGEERALRAVNSALESPLLDSNDIYGTKNILLNIISGGDEITIGEIGEIIETLQERAGQEADIIWGNGYDERLGDQVSVTILATGFKTNPNQLLQPREEPQKFELGREEPVDAMVGEAEEMIEETEEELVVMDDSRQDSSRFFGLGSSGNRDRKSEERLSFSQKRKEKKRTKERSRETAKQGSVDNWFLKNFGFNKLFDDEDQSMDE